MLSKKEQCLGVYLLHYVLFYALLVAYVALTSCSGVREELIPHTNEAIVNMDESGKAAYRQLVAMLTKGEGEVFDQIVRGVKDPKRLSIVLQQMLENLLKDFELLKLLPKPRRVACRQALIKAQGTEKQPGLFDQYKPNLKRINAFPPEYKAAIIALFEMLPDDQAVASYNALGNPASVAQAEQLIASKLPASSLQQLKGDAKEKFLKLSESKQQEIFKMVSSLPPSQVDLIKLVEQKRDKDLQDLKEKKAMPTDPFGDKLPLEGEERKKFVDVVFGFGKMEDIRAAVDLFNAVEKPSIKNFIDAYSFYFSEKTYKKVELGKDGRKRDVETSERRELLATIICLYKRNKGMTIELCNYPERFEGIAKLKLGWYTTVAQREILSQLKKALEKIDREHALRQHKT